MEKLLFTELLVDAGLFVVTWMVQLIVYPGFLAYSPTDLVAWHKRYTPRISWIVAPLMLTQLVISILLAVYTPNVLSDLAFILVLGTWITTFLFFVPIHRQIDQGKAQKKDLNLLIRRNWMRTLLWTSILFINLLNYLS